MVTHAEVLAMTVVAGFENSLRGWMRSEAESVR